MTATPSAAAPPSWTVRPLRSEDEGRWRDLYAGYAAFYKIGQTEAMASRVLDWLLDPAKSVEGIVAVDGSGKVGTCSLPRLRATFLRVDGRLPGRSLR
jgi:hypothetical protein